MAASTAQLVIACQVKADPESGAMRSLEGASVAVRKATDNLVQQAQKIFKREKEEEHSWGSATGVKGMSEVSRFTSGVQTSCDMIAGSLSAVHLAKKEIEMRTKMEEARKAYEESQKQMTEFHKMKYKFN